MDRSQKQFRQPLKDQLNTLQQEARMVLPGIQAIFGFQLVAVFNQNFNSALTHSEQVAHLVAILLVTFSALLVLAPAAYHRATCHQISRHFVDMSNRFLGSAMNFLAIGISTDIYLVSNIILKSTLAASLLSVCTLVIFALFWIILPRKRAEIVSSFPVKDLKPEEVTL